MIPDPGVIWRLIEKHKINVMFLAPTGIRILKKLDPEGEWAKKCDLSSLRLYSLAGERTDSDTIIWITKRLPNVYINDLYGQTESLIP